MADSDFQPTPEASLDEKRGGFVAGLRRRFGPFLKQLWRIFHGRPFLIAVGLLVLVIAGAGFLVFYYASWAFAGLRHGENEFGPEMIPASIAASERVRSDGFLPK